MRKLAAGFMILGLGAMALAGCGNTSKGGENQSDSASGSGGTLKLWMPPNSQTDISDKEGWDEILKPFEEEHGVNVDVTIIPWNSFEEKFQTGIASGEGPDVGYMYTEMIGDYAARDQLVDLDSFLTQEEKDNYLYLDLGLVDGKQLSMPFVIGNARVVFYNKDILDEVGVEVPATWDEFLAATAKIAESGKTAFLAPWGEPHRGVLNELFFPYVWQSGGDLFNADGSKTAFNSPESLEAAQFMLDLQASGAIPSSATGLTGDQAEEAFIRGEGAFLSLGTNKFEKLKSEGVNVGVINSLKNKSQGTFVAADSLVMFESTPDKELAADLIKFITTGSNMAKFHEWADFPPITTDEEYKGAEEFKDLYTENADIFHTLPAIPNSTAAYNALYINLQQMMLGQKTAEQALSDSAAEGDAALTR